MGISVLSPDINESFVEFAVVPDKENPDNRKAPIRFGMAAIKNVGTGAVEEILRARKECDKFEDLSQFLSCVNPRVVNKKALESLIKAGGFDRFGDRSELLHNMEIMLAYANRVQKDASSGQTDLFGNLIEEDSSHLKPQLTLETAVVKYNTREQLLWERELLGLYLSQHPLDMFTAFLEEQCAPLKELKKEHDGKTVTIGGVVTDMREIMTKKGDKMAFVKIEDKSGEIEAILFPRTYQTTMGLWERDKIVLVHGKVNARDRDGKLTDELKILVDDGREITAEQAAAYKATGRKPKVPKGGKRKSSALAMRGPGAKAVDEQMLVAEKVYIRLSDTSNSEILMALKQAIDENRGSTDVVLVLGPDTSKQAIKLPTGMNNAEPALSKLQQLVGAENVKVR